MAGNLVMRRREDDRDFERLRSQNLSGRLAPTLREMSDLREVREVWWRQVALGNRMPAEPVIIVIDGGRASKNSPLIDVVVDLDEADP